MKREGYIGILIKIFEPESELFHFTYLLLPFQNVKF